MSERAAKASDGAGCDGPLALTREQTAASLRKASVKLVAVVDSTSFEQRLDTLNVWRRGDTRAPHKPLLVLLALGELSQGRQELPFALCDIKLTALLREFGPPSRTVHPEYPFWRLQNDGLWVVDRDRPMRARSSNSDPPKSELREASARGHFPDDVRRELLAQPHRIGEAAERILHAHFPSSIHSDILAAVGLEGFEPRSSETIDTVVRRRRDPNFRDAVLMAYQYRCAICGLDLRVGNLTVGLEAAHIKWHQARGPDIVANGVSMCSLHHKLFDLGAFTLDHASTVMVSEQVNGSARFEEVLLRHHGARMTPPMRAEHLPHPEYVNWHQRQVFKREARPMPAGGA